MGPSYPREIGRMLGRDETDIARRLKNLEALGLVESVWKRIGDRNVKIYRLKIKEINIKFNQGKVLLEYGKGEKIVGALDEKIWRYPTQDYLADRDSEIKNIIKSNVPVIIIWGLPGIGKTALVAYIVHRYYNDRPVFWHNISPLDTAETIERKQTFF
jgi:signal recognition particle GTPase